MAIVGESIGRALVSKALGESGGESKGYTTKDAATYTGGMGSRPNPNEHISAADSEVAGGQTDLRDNYDVASARTDDIRAEGNAVTKSELDPQGTGRNLAKNDYDDDNLNNRGFNHTLSLSRQADAYNNKPRYTNVRTTNGSGGHAYVDAGLDRPKLETQEMRQMRTNEQLSARQRQLRQDLQHLVNKKDYDLFVAWYQQKYGLNLNLTQAEQSVITFNRTQQIANIIMQNHQMYTEYLRGYIGAQLAAYITSKAGKGDYIWTSLFMQAYGMTGRPAQLMDYWEEQRVKQIYDLAPKMGGNPVSMINNMTYAFSNMPSQLGNVQQMLNDRK